jgi:methionyl-tRNA formyltransferase
MLDDKRVKIFPPVQITDIKNGEAGSITLNNGKVRITCSDASLELSDVQVEGGKKLPAIEVMRGILKKDNNTLLH